MNVPRRNQQSQYYLDVTQYVLTEHRLRIPSPIASPLPSHPNQMYSPGNIPLVLDVEGVELSPYFTMNENAQIEFIDFTLQIPEEEEEESFENLNVIEEQSREDEDEFEEDSDEQFSQEDISHKRESFSQSLQYYSDLPSSKLNIHYFKCCLAELRKKKSPEAQIREFLVDYLTPENCTEENLDDDDLDTLIKVAEHNLRPLGPISWLERRSKVLKFKNKKNRRSWNKKINYDCRKKVADSRLRVKGKFVTKEQACNILGVNETSQDSIKQLLELKFSHSK